MEHALGRTVETVLYGLVFIGMLTQLVHNIILQATAEGIILIGGLTFIAGDLFFGSLIDLVRGLRGNRRN